MIYQFKITLKDVMPPIWRRFQADSSITFDQLHKTIQIVMGWEDYHLYEFDFGKRAILLPDPEFPSDRRKELHAKKEKVVQHFTEEGQAVDYIYDYGDFWVHELVLEKILPEEDNSQFLICLDGKRNGPPEDCGGVYGYQQIVESLTIPNHPDYEEHAAWLEDGFDPEHFDKAEVNERLHELAKLLSPLQTKAPTTPLKPVKLTPAKLKKHLQGLSHAELIQMLTECFKMSKETEHFLTVKVLGEEAIQSLLEVYRKKITDEFFPARGFGKLRLAEAKKAIREFEKITQSKRYTLELKMHYVEMGVQFTNTYGDIDERFYDSVEKMYQSVIEMINEEQTSQLFNEYEERLIAVVRNTEGIGWGFHDQLAYLYCELRW